MFYWLTLKTPIRDTRYWLQIFATAFVVTLMKFIQCRLYARAFHGDLFIKLNLKHLAGYF